MTQPVLKRHPRRAVWFARALDGLAPLVCGLSAVAFALAGAWYAAGAWLAGLLMVIAYEVRTRRAWRWAWRAGKEATLERMMPLVRTDDWEALREVYMAEGPSWRQEQDRLMQIDHRATMVAAIMELEQAWRRSPH